jgi:hypothetical protein
MVKQLSSFQLDLLSKLYTGGGGGGGGDGGNQPTRTYETSVIMMVDTKMRNGPVW